MRQLLTLCLLLVLAPGCATILRGKSQSVKFETDPDAANITIDGKDYTSPMVVDLTRKDTHEVTVAKAGYQPMKFNLEAEWDGLSLTSLLPPGGSILFALDQKNGADRSFDRLAKITLAKTDKPSPPIEMYVFDGRLMTKDEFEKAKTQAHFDPKEEP